MIHNPGAKARRPRRVLLLLLLLALAGWLLRPTHPLYTVTDLGDSAFEASAINNSGQIVLGSQISTTTSLRLSTSTGQAGAFLKLPQPPNGNAGGSAINDKGEITGFVGAAGSDNHALLFSAGRMHDMGTLPGFAGSYGTGINSRGQVVGAMYVSNSVVAGSSKRAFLYSGGRMAALPLLPGKPESQAFGINGSGQVAGDCTQGFGTSRAFLYESATRKMTALPMPPGYTGSYAHGINDSGQMIGEIDGAQPSGHAALWQGGSVKDLGTPPGTNMSIGLAINNQGQAVGNAFKDNDAAWPRFLRYLQRFEGRHAAGAVSSGESAWVYRDGKTTDLNTLIPAHSGWQLEEAHGINDRGQIVGRGLRHGQQRAFLLTPVP